ncbi:MAG: carbohydrate ABC transporter permease [bacterium]|nr:carbohydrate ABC transporter permease [bacterium]
MLLGLFGLTIVPFVMMLVMSLKSNGQIFAHFWSLPHPAHWEYYPLAWQAIFQYIRNSLIVTMCSVIGVVLLSSLSGYVFARHRFTGKETIYYFILLLMMIPGVLTLIPAYELVRSLGLLNTRWVLILPYISGGQVFGILLCRGFMATIPEELFESARMDGASELQVYWRMAVPLSLPILATVAIMNAVGIYNDYIWPLVTISDHTIQTFTVGVTQFASEYNLDYGPMLAGYVIGSIPLICIFAIGTKYYVQGITSGALKV